VQFFFIRSLTKQILKGQPCETAANFTYLSYGRQGRPKGRENDGARVKGRLPQVTGLIQLDVHPPRVILMGKANALCHGGFQFWIRDIVNVVGHEGVAGNGHVIEIFVRSEKFEMQFAVPVVEKDRLAIVTSLGDMVWPSGHDQTGNAYHA
jgi:hypothetical protein